MKPARLKRGDLVRMRNPAAPPERAPVLMFVERDVQRRASVLYSATYVGQFGPGDTGHVTVTDWHMSRHYERLTVAPAP